VAWLMDKDEFLADLQKAREELGVSDNPIAYEAAKEWFKVELQKEQKKTSIKKVFDPLSETNRFIFPKTKSERLTAKLLEKYHKSPLYFEAIKYAIVTGVVTDKEFTKTAFCQVLPPDYQMIDTEHGITKKWGRFSNSFGIRNFAYIKFQLAPLKDLFCNHKLEFDFTLQDIKTVFETLQLRPALLTN